jgi:hypothetical protein
MKKVPEKISRDQQARTARFFMAALVYKEFLIIAFGMFDKEKEVWMPRVDVSWHSATGLESHTINDSVDCFGTKLEAETFGVEVAKAWIDARFKAA